VFEDSIELLIIESSESNSELPLEDELASSLIVLSPSSEFNHIVEFQPFHYNMHSS
jgi:hypothetical protein